MEKGRSPRRNNPPPRTPRPAYFTRLARRFRHDEDSDLIDGVYSDVEGDRIGIVILPEARGELPDTMLVVPDADVAPIHAESSLEADHRVISYEAVVAILYLPGEEPRGLVPQTGGRWDAGDQVAYVFDTEDDAMAAQAGPRERERA